LQSGCGLVAACYSGRIGTPALFSRRYFADLLQIEGQGGAKSLLERHASGVLPIDFPEAACDLDTPEDVAEFTKNEDTDFGVDRSAVNDVNRTKYETVHCLSHDVLVGRPN
ncbi:MAG: hypothetical protein JWO45_928, partial [Spartobacteria bacterium]|nr:hypothetical protein [Spartobacteria bacterium]